MLQNFAHEITVWLHQNPEWGGVIAFAVALAESLAIVGIFVPALIFFTAIGALITSGVLPLTPILLWTFAGAIIGDGASYLIGYYYRDQLQRMWPFNKYQKLLNKGQRFFTKHGRKSVFISRFVGPLRSIIPIVAGMMDMKPRRFFMVNIPSAVLWTPFYMSGGFLLGEAATFLAPHSAQHFIVVIGIALLAITMIIFLLRWLISVINRRLHGKLMRIEGLQRIFFNAIDFNHAQQTFLGLSGLVCLILFSAILLLIISNVGIDVINFQVHSFFQNDRNPLGDQFFIFTTLLGQTGILIPWTGAIALYFFIGKNWRTAKYFLVLILTSITATHLLQTMTHYPSTQGLADAANNFSFPSSHIVLSTCIYGFLAYLIAAEFERQYHQWAFYITAIVIFAISISRLYLGMHGLTDVVGSALLGFILVLAFIILYRRKLVGKIKLSWFIPILIISFAIIYGTYAWLNYATLLASYQPAPIAIASVMMPGPVLV